MANKTARFLAYGCKHVPFHDPEYIAWLLAQIEVYKPDYVLDLGDGHEAAGASRWPHEYKHTLKQEYEQHNAILHAVRMAAPKGAKCIFLPGNHDDNILAPCRIDSQLRDLCDWREVESEFKDRHWLIGCQYEYARKRGTYKLGAVTFAHGYEHGVSSDETQSITLGMPYGLFVSAHTHRPTMYVMRAQKTKRVKLPYWYANVGCGRDMKPDYVKRRLTADWGQACVVGECELTQSPRLSKSWDAHMEIYRISDDL